MLSSGFVMMVMIMAASLFGSSVRSNPVPLVPAAIANDFFEILRNESSMSMPIVVPTNQGRFASKSLVEVKAKAKNIGSAEMLKRTGGDGSTQLENAWVRVAQGDDTQVYHFSLLLKFADEKCERMEFYPDYGHEDVLGEHPSGRVILSPDSAAAACKSTASFLGIPESGGASGIVSLVQKFKGFAKQDADLIRWTKADGNINRRQLYDAFLEEAGRFKNEKKYSCASFAFNVFEDASNQQSVSRSTMVSLIQAASKLRLRGSDEEVIDKTAGLKKGETAKSGFPTDGIYCNGRDWGCQFDLRRGDGDCDYDSECYGNFECGDANCIYFYSTSDKWPASHDKNGWDKNDDCCHQRGQPMEPLQTNDARYEAWWNSLTPDEKSYIRRNSQPQNEPNSQPSVW